MKDSPLASIVKDCMKKIDNDNLTGKIESPEKVELKEVLDPNIKEVASNDVPDKPPDKDYILKLLQQSISENVAKSNKKQVPLTPNPGQTEKPLQSQKMQSCAHPPLKEQVCKDALTSAGNQKLSINSPALISKTVS